MDTFIKTNCDKSQEHLAGTHQDLVLAAEIGKSLLERNRELESLLKSTQDYVEEQAAQIEFYCRQIESLRETSDATAQSYEQLESKNQQLLQKHDEQKAECKILQGKNNRLWELIGSLEKRNEKLSVELLDLTNKKVVSEQSQREDVNDRVRSLECDNINLKKSLSELKVELKIAKLRKEEVESHMDDVLSQNQLLQHNIANLNQEIHEWECFAQKGECYRKIAEAYSIKHSIDYDDCLIDKFNTTKQLSKAKSCDFLNDIQREQADVIKSANLVNNVFSSVNSGSFLSELDTEYADLVKRYEALLEKCKQEGKFNENPERTRKVQRAMQTLTFDITTWSSTSCISSPVKENTAVLHAPKNLKSSFSSTGGKTLVSTAASMSTADGEICESRINYRQMFADIFAKIKESKDQCF